MANLFIGLSGEGRGHATRVRALVEHLGRDHQISLFAPGDAFAFLAPLYRRTEVEVRRIAGMRFHYTPRRRLAYGRTGVEALAYLRRLPMLTSMLGRIFEEDKPDLVITDFEPALPRVARQRQVPFVSVDHQHVLTACDLTGLPRKLRWHAALMGAIVRAWCPGEEEAVVSSFYFPPLRRGRGPVTQVGVMLRQAVRDATVRAGEHIVVYCRRFAGNHALAALRDCGRPARIYGLGHHPPDSNLTFRAIDETAFLEDLASCSALVCTAGNQLVGEALYLGKPVLALPEARNFEQYINAHFLRLGGGGDWLEFERLSGPDLRHFLRDVDAGRFRLRHPRERLDGIPATLAALARYLPLPRRPELPPAVPRIRLPPTP